MDNSLTSFQNRYYFTTAWKENGSASQCCWGEQAGIIYLFRDKKLQKLYKKIGHMSMSWNMNAGGGEGGGYFQAEKNE